VGQHDLSYRLFFVHRLMIRDLLREILEEPWVERIDLDSGSLAETSFVSAKHEKRASDVIWKFQRKDGGEPVHVYVLLEFQSRPDPSMPVRFMGYESLFYQRLMVSEPAASWRKLPPVVPILLYNGSERWNVATDLGPLLGDLDASAETYRPQLRYRLVDEAAYPLEKLMALSNPVAELFRIERCQSWPEVLARLPRLRRSIPASETSLRRAFATWLQKVVQPRFRPSPEETSVNLTLEEIETMLAENIDRWNREIWEDGRKEGRQEGEADLVLRQLRLKFGPLEPDVEDRVRSADADRLLEWGERILTAESLQDVFRD
jgi:predicted transposase/invertase (TIGR01784 family)